MPRDPSTSLGMTILCFATLRRSVDHYRPMSSETSTPAYKRIVLKLSGEALRERGAKENISPAIVREIAERIKEVKALGVQTSVVIGGGSILRGLAADQSGNDPTTPGYIGA